MSLRPARAWPLDLPTLGALSACGDKEAERDTAAGRTAGDESDADADADVDSGADPEDRSLAPYRRERPSTRD